MPDSDPVTAPENEKTSPPPFDPTFEEGAGTRREGGGSAETERVKNERVFLGACAVLHQTEPVAPKIEKLSKRTDAGPRFDVHQTSFEASAPTEAARSAHRPHLVLTAHPHVVRGGGGPDRH